LYPKLFAETSHGHLEKGNRLAKVHHWMVSRTREEIERGKVKQKSLALDCGIRLKERERGEILSQHFYFFSRRPDEKRAKKKKKGRKRKTAAPLVLPRSIMMERKGKKKKKKKGRSITLLHLFSPATRKKGKKKKSALRYY